MIISNWNTKYYEHNLPNISAKLRLIHAEQIVHQRRSMYITSPVKHTKYEIIITLPLLKATENLTNTTRVHTLLFEALLDNKKKYGT